MTVSSGWVAAGVSILLIMGMGSAAYTDLKSDVAVVATKMEASITKHAELDRYDAQLSRESDGLEHRLTRSEATSESIIQNQVRIETTMTALLDKVTEMNNNLIRMGAVNGN